MRIVVLGAGALGLLFGWYLSSDNDVVCVSRRHVCEAINKNGLSLVGGFSESTKRIRVVENIEKVNIEPQLVILASKSFDSKKNLEIIKRNWPKSNVLTLQNGIYTEEKAKELFDASQVFPSSVMIGSRFLNNHTIEHFLDKGMVVGCLGDNKHFLGILVKTLLKSGLRARETNNIMREKWRKFMFYCSCATLNALTATLNLAYEHTFWIVDRALREIVEIAKYLELDFDVEKVAEEVADFSLHFEPQRWNASVGEDLKKGKRTEIEFLNGYVVDLAKRFNLDVPVNDTLYRLVKTLERTGYYRNFVEMK